MRGAARTRATALRSLALALAAPIAVRAQAQAPETMRLASAPDDDVTPVLYAQRAGLFAKAGLDVGVSRMNNGAAVSAAVVGGSIDLGKSSLLPLISAHAHGVPFELIAPSGLWLAEAPVTALIVEKSASLSSARDLSGKTVSSSGLNDLMSNTLRHWIATTGGDVGAVRLVELPSSAVLPALADGRVDAAMIGNPYLAQALASEKVRVLAYPGNAVARRFLTAAWFANAAYVARHRVLVERFVRVLAAAAVYTNAHRAETVEAVAAFSGIDAATIAHMTRSTAGVLLDPQELRPLVELAASNHQIDRAFDPRELISAAALRSYP